MSNTLRLCYRCAYRWRVALAAVIVRDAQGGVLPGVVAAAEHLATGARVERAATRQGAICFRCCVSTRTRWWRRSPGHGRGPDASGGHVGDQRRHREPGGRPDSAFELPNRIFGTPNFGRIFAAKNAREMQLGLKLSF